MTITVSDSSGSESDSSSDEQEHERVTVILSGCAGKPDKLLAKFRGLNIDTSQIVSLPKAKAGTKGLGPRAMELKTKVSADKFVKQFRSRLGCFNPSMHAALECSDGSESGSDSSEDHHVSLVLSGCVGKPPKLLSKLRGLNIDTTQIVSLAKAKPGTKGLGPRTVTLKSKASADKFAKQFRAQLGSFNPSMTVKRSSPQTKTQGKTAKADAKRLRQVQRLERDVRTLKRKLKQGSNSRRTDPRERAKSFRSKCVHFAAGNCHFGSRCRHEHVGNADSDSEQSSPADTESDSDTSDTSCPNLTDARSPRPYCDQSDCSHSHGRRGKLGSSSKRSKRSKRPKGSKRSKHKHSGKRGKAKRKGSSVNSNKDICYRWRDSGECDRRGCPFSHCA